MNTKLLRRLRRKYQLKLDFFYPWMKSEDNASYSIHGGLAVIDNFTSIRKVIEHMLFWELKWVGLWKYRHKKENRQLRLAIIKNEEDRRHYVKMYYTFRKSTSCPPSDHTN